MKCITRRPDGEACRGMWVGCAVHRVWMSGQWHDYPVQVPILHPIAFTELPRLMTETESIVTVYCGPGAHLPARPSFIPRAWQITQTWPTSQIYNPDYLVYVHKMTEYTHDVYAHLYEVRDNPSKGMSTLVWKVWDR